MKTDDLISALSTDLERAPRHAVGFRLSIALAVGIAVSFVAMWLWLGPRPDMMPAMATPMFWMKLVYALSIAAFGFGLADRLARPDGQGGVWRTLLFLPLAFMIVMALYRYVQAPPEQHMAMLLGGSWTVCARNIVLLSLPVFAALFWSLRDLAPTRLTAAGATAGVLAGAVGTFIYAFHCTESAAPFVAIWYTLGMAVMGALGAVLGRFLLRW
ncbi:MAG: DUF1109 domain-containing protein [Alphaproteobacteria bacterium]|nr:DUF1109 domain-containing protein [Alphaproteobacteria bacterium]MBL6937944.1 DUF1109 domain-containing protein [Alphaproteobacteria bacterium]MBL7099231.1 DUF1109 domain-containing protein [Alphaproteobacteria bacterium]